MVGGLDAIADVFLLTGRERTAFFPKTTEDLAGMPRDHDERIVCLLNQG